jgi:hypothetical protein
MTRQDGRLRTQGRGPIKLLTRGDMFFPVAVDPKDIPSTDLDDAMQKFEDMVTEGEDLKTEITRIGITAPDKAKARKAYDQWKAMRKMELRDDVYRLLLDELNETFDLSALKDSMDKRCNVDFDKYRKNFIDNADENLDFLEPKIWMDWKRDMFVSRLKKDGILGRLNNQKFRTENRIRKYIEVPGYTEVQTRTGIRQTVPKGRYFLDDNYDLVTDYAGARGIVEDATRGNAVLEVPAIGAGTGHGNYEAATNTFTIPGYLRTGGGVNNAGDRAGIFIVKTEGLTGTGRMTTETFKRAIGFDEFDYNNGFCPVNTIMFYYQNGNEMEYANIFNIQLPNDKIASKVKTIIKDLDRAYNKCFKAELKKLHSQEPYLYPLKLTGGVPHRMYQGPVGELSASGDAPDVLLDGRRRRRRSSSKRKRLSRRSKRKSRGSKSKRKSKGSKRKSKGSKRKSRGSKRRSKGSRKRRGSRRH